MEKKEELDNEYWYFLWEKIFDINNIFDNIINLDRKYWCIVDLYYELWYINLHHMLWWNLSNYELDKRREDKNFIITKTLEYIKPFIQKWIVKLKVLKQFYTNKEIWNYLKTCVDKEERKYLINFLKEGGLNDKTKNYLMLLPEKIFTKDSLEDFESFLLERILNPNTERHIFEFTTQYIQIELTPECREAFEKERKERNEK